MVTVKQNSTGIPENIMTEDEYNFLIPTLDKISYLLLQAARNYNNDLGVDGEL
jgi:hypothetical protein